jgi:hypothetical protein
MLLAVSWYYQFTETASGDTIVFARSGWSTALLFLVLALWLSIGVWLCREGWKRSQRDNSSALKLTVSVALVVACLYVSWVNVRMIDDRCEVTHSHLDIQEYTQKHKIAYDNVTRIEWYQTTERSPKGSLRRVANILITLKSGETLHLTGDMVDAASRKAAARMIDSGQLSSGDILDRAKQSSTHPKP